jgi:chitinase
MKFLALVLIGLGGIFLLQPSQAQTPKAPVSPHPTDIWIFAYYLAGDQDNHRLPPEKIDFTAFSHLIHFDVLAESDGTIDPIKGGITPEQSRTVLTLAHQAGCKVLLGLGTDEGAKRLRMAMHDAARPNLVKNLVQFVTLRGYDGIDIDEEPLDDIDVPDYEKFIPELRTAMDAARPGLLLTAAVATQPALFARLQPDFDRINLMTYDLSGPWPGFKTWYNGSLYGDGTQKMDKDDPYPSVDDMVQKFVQAGISPAKLGIGIAFYGYVWSGATAPRQDIAGLSVDDGVDYNVIMDKYYQPTRYHWDDRAQAPYLSVESENPKERKFISYDDETLCAKKIAFVRQKGLGGAIIWELGGGYRDSQPTGKKDALLQSVKRAWHSPTKERSSQQKE